MQYKAKQSKQSKDQKRAKGVGQKSLGANT